MSGSASPASIFGDGIGAQTVPKPKSRLRHLNEHLFFSMNHARAVVAGWVEGFNTARPHSAIGYMTPAAYAATLNPPRASTLRRN